MPRLAGAMTMREQRAPPREEEEGGGRQWEAGWERERREECEHRPWRQGKDAGREEEDDEDEEETEAGIRAPAEEEV